MWTFLHARFQTTGLCIGNMKGVASSCHIYESILWKNLVKKTIIQKADAPLNRVEHDIPQGQSVNISFPVNW